MSPPATGLDRAPAGGQGTVVVGAGLAGLTTALELLGRGLPVTVVEARAGIALATSHANGAMLAPSTSAPWNAPGVYRHLAASLFDPHAPLKLHLSAIPSLFAWGLKFLRNSTASRQSAATRANFLLGRYSLDCTRELRARLGLEYDAATLGTLKVFRRPASLQASLAVAESLRTFGLRFEVLDRRGAVAAEPSLDPIREQIVAALRFPDDESGDAYKFCTAVARAIESAGGQIRLGEPAVRIEISGGKVSGVHLREESVPAARVVVATGNSAASLLRPMGLSLPIAPAKGYTITLAADSFGAGPSIPVLDAVLHAAVVPVGDRLRLAGTAEFTGSDLALHPTRIASVRRVLGALFPQTAARTDWSTAAAWTGLRPVSADGLPFIGPTAIDGLFVNTGHGHLGWTLAAGSARLLADLITGARPGIDPAPYRSARD